MLGGWILDKGKCTKHYKHGIQLCQMRARSGVRWIWLSRAESERRIGAEELKDRVQRQTIKWKRNPEDNKYYQFRLLGLTEATGSRDEMIQWKKSMKDPRNFQDFEFDEETPDEVEDDDPLG